MASVAQKDWDALKAAGWTVEEAHRFGDRVVYSVRKEGVADLYVKDTDREAVKSLLNAESH